VKGKKGYMVRAELSFDEVDIDEFVGLILPGGKGPEHIRNIPKVTEIVRRMHEAGKPIAAICHGPQILISANLLGGKRVTCYHGIRDDVKAAGAEYLDMEVVVDDKLVTSRVPDDLPYMMKEFIRLLK
jgi:protease I